MQTHPESNQHVSVRCALNGSHEREIHVVMRILATWSELLFDMIKV